jgi:hypothetical protein
MEKLKKGAANIQYGDIKNWEIEKTGTSKMKQREYERKTTAISKLKLKTGKSKMWLGTHFSIIPQYRFVRNFIKYLITGYHHNTVKRKNTVEKFENLGNGTLKMPFCL